MRVLRDEFFIRKDFAFYDSCLQVVLGNNLFFAYETLRRYVWRGRSKVSQVRALRKQGLVVTRISQGKLAELVGFKHRQSINKVIGDLKKLGWIRVLPAEDHGPACYILGEMVTSSVGGSHEVFYADAYCQAVLGHLEVKLAEDYPELVPARDPDDLDRGNGPEPDEAPEERRSNLHRTPVSWRCEKVRQFIDLTCTEQVSSNPEPSGGERDGIQGVNAEGFTEEENSEVENLEIDKGEGPVAALPPSPLSGAEENSPARSFAGKLKVPRGVLEEPTLSESGEYPSVPPPPPAPIPKWMQESPGVAVGDDRARGPVPKVMSDVHVDAPASPRPRVPERLAGIVAEASARGRKAAEEQLQKAKARETKLASLGGKPIPVTRKKQLTALESQWKELMEARFPGTQIAAWEGKERGQVWNLVEKYTGEIVGEALHYLVERWDEIRTRMLKGRGGVPSVGFLLRFHDVLVIESQRWTEYRYVKKQVDDWYGGDPYKPSPPQELHQRYLALRKEMADLGLPV